MLQHIFLFATVSFLPQEAGAPEPAAPQEDPPARSTPAPGSREAMWPAPTADDWAKPVQITWQRTWEDARAVSEETGRPILIAVNMDGEIASEHYAGIRYRDPEIAKFHEPYVNVIASVYRHNPRDYDEKGERVLCPRFGSVTCGEHIAMEPMVYDQFLDKTRVAPRHIGVELDGTEFYDVFYALDVKSVFETIDEEYKKRPDTTKPDADAERTLEELVASRRVEHRRIVEQQFKAAKKAERQRLLDLSGKLGEKAPIEVLRLAIFGLDVEIASEARQILSLQRSDAAIDLIAEALSVPMPAAEREALVGALEAMAPEFPRARSLSVALRGLSAEPASEELAKLAQKLSSTEVPDAVQERYEAEARLEAAARTAAAKPSPELVIEAETLRAENMLRLAVDPGSRGTSAGAGAKLSKRFEELQFMEAREAALVAEAAGGASWRTAAVKGLCAFYLGEGEATWHGPLEEAYRGMTTDPGAQASDAAVGWMGMAVMSLFADKALGEIRAASRAGTPFEPARMTEVNAAFDLLAQHPLGTDEHAIKHFDFLIRLGARRRAFNALDRGLERFPSSSGLHARLRDRLLFSQGVDGLLSHYGERAAAATASATDAWYAGYAAMVGAEYRRRRGEPEGALGAYDQAMEHFAQAVQRDASTKDSAEHYAAMCLAGKARIAMEEGQHKGASELLLAAFTRWPEASNALDGLNASAVTTAALVRAKLLEAGDVASAEALQKGLDALDPKLLLPPDFETPPDTPAARNRDRRGRQRPARRDGR